MSIIPIIVGQIQSLIYACCGFSLAALQLQGQTGCKAGRSLPLPAPVVVGVVFARFGLTSC